MNKRRVAVRLAVVGLVAMAGVGIAATPVLAMTPECQSYAYWNRRAAIMMNQDGITFAQWNGWYDLWLHTESLLDSQC